MKLLLIFALIVLLAGSLVGELIVQDPGYVLVSFKSTIIETSIWGLGLIVILSFTAFYLLLQFAQYLMTRRRKINEWRKNHARNNADRKTLNGLNALSAGNWSKAERLLSQAAPNSGVSLVNYLAAAQAAHEQNQHESCDALLDEARLAAPKADVAVGIIQSQIQIDRGHWESALATLTRLRSKAPKHSYILKLLTQTYTELQDWGSMVQLLPDLRKRNVYPPEQLQQLEQKIYLGHLAKSLESVGDGEGNEARQRMLGHGWKSVPKTLQNDDNLIERQVELLLECDGGASAEKFLSERLKKQWSSKLVELYGRIEGADVNKQFRQARDWEQMHSGDANLQLTLGRLALRNSEWEQAQNYFQKSLELSPSQVTYAELARLLHNRSNGSTDPQVLDQYVDSLTASLPELPQPEVQPEPVPTESEGSNDEAAKAQAAS
ncbi:heme biosynthesis HemY N-terminal domain-containing protein [Motiliproteus sp.]|uniref:heme biosynthesis HemY N-terminal domain-containing protein n=1 Tax=Motiliproteus sp. TaxID=1898955 RepID=UPI003BA8CFBF